MITAVRESLRGKAVYMRPTTAEDLEIFMNWREMADPQSQSLQVEPIKPAGYWKEQFKQTGVDPDMVDLALARSKDDGIIGRFVFDNLNLLNRSGRLTVLYDPELKKLNDVEDGALVLSSFLFRQYNLNSIYSSAMQVNRSQCDLLETIGFQRDGILRQRHFYDGEFHDVYAYSLLRYEADI